MDFILTRHTTTDWNVLKRIQGHTDRDLTPDGEREARVLGERLSRLETPITRIRCSDLLRARHTAEIIADRLQLPWVPDARLRECSFGALEGLTREQVAIQFGPAAHAQLDDHYSGYDFRPYGGEEKSAVLARHTAALMHEVAAGGAGMVLFVGHHRGMLTLLHGLGELPKLERGDYWIVRHEPIDVVAARG